MHKVLHADRVTPTIRRAERLLTQGEWAKSCRALDALRLRAANSQISLEPWRKRLDSLTQKLYPH